MTHTNKETSDTEWGINWKAIASKKMMDSGVSPKTTAELIITLDGLFEHAFTSRDTYWKERVRKIVDIVKYDSCIYQGSYAEHRARGGDELRKILLQSITNEDNLK